MDTSKIKEIIEIDCGSDIERVNTHLKQGWQLLRTRTVTKKEDADTTIEYLIYVLGRPSA